MEKALPRTDFYKIKEISDKYHYRPQYNKALFQQIQDYIQQCGSETHLAVDVACGNGVSTLPLAEFCDKVLAFDISETQLANAPKNVPNVNFRVGNAYNMTSFVEPESVDLVTIGTALHWLDQDRFFKSVNEVLKPGGVFVAYCYDYETTFLPEAADKVHKKFIQEMTESYDVNQELKYRQLGDLNSIDSPFPSPTRKADVILQRKFTVDEYIVNQESYSLVHQYNEFFKDKKPVESLAKRMKAAVEEEKKKNPEYDGTIDTYWPVKMLLAQKPKK